MSPTKKRPRRVPKKKSFDFRDFFLNLSLAFVSTAFVFLALELGVRFHERCFELTNFISKDRTLLQSGQPSDYHPLLGWVPKANFHSKPTMNFWRTNVTLLDDGIRSNGVNGADPAPGPAILAVGDSFTFGDEVSDEQTWPSQLEALSGRKVINGGVFAYGIDQVYLRAEMLVKKYKPGVLIFSLIYDDVNRCAMVRRNNAYKPYYEMNGDELTLKNVPVPLPDVFRLDPVRKVLGHSLLVHKLMMAKHKAYWLKGLQGWDDHERNGADDERISCLLLRKLERLAKENDLKVYVVFQYLKGEYAAPDSIAGLARLKACVLSGTSRIKFIDTREETAAIAKTPPAYEALYVWSHMSQEGNGFIAKLILKNLEDA